MSETIRTIQRDDVLQTESGEVTVVIVAISVKALGPLTDNFGATTVFDVLLYYNDDHDASPRATTIRLPDFRTWLREEPWRKLPPHEAVNYLVAKGGDA